MKKFLLPVLFGAVCTAPAAADLYIDGVQFPENAVYNETANITLSLDNDGDGEITDYTVEVIRGFTESERPLGFTPTIVKNYMTEPLAVIKGEEAIPVGTSELTVPVFFELGGSYSLIFQITYGDGQVEKFQPKDEELLVSMPVESKSYELSLPSGDVSGFSNSFSDFNGFSHVAQQIIYPASKSELPRNAIINSLKFYYRPESNVRPQMRYRVYLSTCDANTTTYSSATPFTENLVLVYDNIIPKFKTVAGATEDTPLEEWVLELGCPFEYDITKNLVITLVGDPGKAFSQRGLPYFLSQYCKVDGNDEYISVYQRWDEDGDFFSNVEKKSYRVITMPKVTLGYQFVAEEETIELGIDAVTAPQDVVAGDPATFRALVVNSGTAHIDTFTLELLDMTADPENPAVLASEEIATGVDAAGDLNAKLKYTFENEGEYKLAMRVSVEGDVDLTNNLSEVFDLHVGPSVGVKVVEAGSNSLAYAAGKILVGIADAASLQVAAADGRVVLAEALNGETEVMAALPMGVYVARVVTAGGNTYIAKFIVK